MYCGCPNFRWVPIFVVFVKGPIHAFQYQQKRDFLYEFWSKTLATYFEPHKCVILLQPMKIGTNENKAIHSIVNINV